MIIWTHGHFMLNVDTMLILFLLLSNDLIRFCYLLPIIQKSVSIIILKFKNKWRNWKGMLSFKFLTFNTWHFVFFFNLGQHWCLFYQLEWLVFNFLKINGFFLWNYLKISLLKSFMLIRHFFPFLWALTYNLHLGQRTIHKSLVIQRNDVFMFKASLYFGE